MDPKSLSALLYVGLGLLLVGVSIPLIQNNVRPNLFYGFRVPKTLNNPDVWYKANHYAGVQLCRAGALTAVFAALAYLPPFVSVDTYALAVMAVVMAALGVAVTLSFVYLRGL